MQHRRVWWQIALLCALTPPARAQFQGPADYLSLSAQTASTWLQDGASVVQLEENVVVETDRMRATAERAVVWLTRQSGSRVDQYRVELVLLGNARIEENNGISQTQKACRLDFLVRPNIRLSASRRDGANRSASDTYVAAAALRATAAIGAPPPPRWLLEEEIEPPRVPATRPAPAPRLLRPVTFSAPHLTTEQTPEGLVAVVMSGGIHLRQRLEKGDLLDLQAESAVVFTTYRSLTELPADPASQGQAIAQRVTGAYLEGDVRITSTPADATVPTRTLIANRAFYDFTTDRAVLTDVVLHTADPRRHIPIIVRARVLRQLSKTPQIEEYGAEEARISTSSFHTPSYSIGASSVYVRMSEFDNPVTGTRTTFSSRHTTFDLWNVPVFYTPAAAGSITERNVLRDIEIASSGPFGLGVSSEWGFFETLGRLPPRGTDMSYRLDHFSERGPAVGLDGRYTGGFVDQLTLQPWSYSGEFTGYMVFDHGEDDLGRRRVDVDPQRDVRGRLTWEHQHFFPDDWQVQITGSYISDPTFLEQWFTRDFRTSRPLDTSFYAKRQRGSEALTLLLSIQPNDFATVAEMYQEQFEIQRLPELGYYRIGDSFWNDGATFFSANTVSALSFQNSDYDLGELGFRPAPVGFASPGLPSVGQTLTPDDTTLRGDFRQEIDFPFSAGPFRVVPYVVGRYSAYSESVDGGSVDRLYAGAGLRMSTAFWKVDDTVKSRLFDLNRLRHVIEPQLELYVGAQNTDRSELLIYDEPIDAVSDVGAVRLAFNQRWQTKRGGPGRWRSVDAFTLNLAANYFFNRPDDRELEPLDFRGLYFASMPEASLARSGIEMDAAWLISDTVRLVGDAQFNTDEAELATAGVGFRVRQERRLSYYLGYRHIGVQFEQVVNGNTFIFEDRDLIVFSADYQLTSDYRLGVANSYDLAHQRNDRSIVSLTRQFDRFYGQISIRVDQFQDERAIFFNVWPEGLDPGRGSRSAQQTLGF